MNTVTDEVIECIARSAQLAAGYPGVRHEFGTRRDSPKKGSYIDCSETGRYVEGKNLCCRPGRCDIYRHQGFLPRDVFGFN